MPVLKEKPRKNITLGRGIIKDTTYVNIDFINCKYTTFKRVKFKNCTFTNNSFVEYQGVTIDRFTKIY